MSEQTVSVFPEDYTELLGDIKLRVRHGQTRAMLAVNAELIRLYWDIGALIHSRQQQQGWGTSVIPRLARDLRNELPEEKRFSERNINQMLAFYREYANLEFLQQPVAKLEAGSEPQRVPQAVALFPVELIQSVPWGHHGVLISKVKDPATRQWYMRAAIENGWSRNTLVMQIETAAHQRQGKTTSNFALRLPPPDSDFVQQSLKDPYLFDFLTLEAGFHERELETGLILCQQPNRVLAEYALRGVEAPIGISSYELTRALPETLQTSLPSIEQIEQELEGGNEPE